MSQRLLRAGVVGVMAAAVALGALVSSNQPAEAVIHEIVAAYCSGGGVGTISEDGGLEPPGLSDPSKSSFARPVIANGSVDPGTFTITDHPSAKFTEGSNVFALDSSNVDHASAEHCPGASSLP